MPGVEDDGVNVMNSLNKQSSIFCLVLAASLLWFSTSMAKGPPEKVTVTAANPNAALQGAELDVVISGSGFGHESTVKFLVTGTNDASQIDVGTVEFDEVTGNLIANISVLDLAVVDLYDIEVRTTSGRRGKGTTLFAVKKDESSNLMRADFRDADSDGMRSDGLGWLLPSECGTHDYVDKTDSCWGSWEPQQTSSHALLQVGWFLRTNDIYSVVPDRWLVLDFSKVGPQGQGGGACPDLDTFIFNYEGRDPDATSYVDSSPCIDLVEVRLFFDEAFTPGALETAVRLIVDGPDLVSGKGKNATPYTQWNPKFYLNFVNPLTITPGGEGSIVVGADGDDFRAEVWTVNSKNGKHDELLGMYWMHFEVHLDRVP
jgi:hypothetical protein